jgi:class 3 adenylate cyclase
VVKSTGDGLLATFDGPARAVRCAAAIRDDLAELGLPSGPGCTPARSSFSPTTSPACRAHRGADLSARRRGEILVSSTVKDLVVGSGLEFDDRGAHELKGVPGRVESVHGSDLRLAAGRSVIGLGQRRHRRP